MTLSLAPWKTEYEPFCAPSGPRDKYILPFVDPEDVRFSISEILYVPLRGSHAEGCGTIAVRLKRMTRKIETKFQHGQRNNVINIHTLKRVMALKSTLYYTTIPRRGVE